MVGSIWQWSHSVNRYSILSQFRMPDVWRSYKPYLHICLCQLSISLLSSLALWGCKHLPFTLWKFTLEQKYWSNKRGLVFSILWKIFCLSKGSVFNIYVRLILLLNSFFWQCYFFYSIYNWGKRCEMLFFTSIPCKCKPYVICFPMYFVLLVPYSPNDWSCEEAKDTYIVSLVGNKISFYCSFRLMC